MSPDIVTSLNTLLLALAAGLLSVVAYFVKELHAEFKLLRSEVQHTKDRVLILETSQK